MQIKNCLSAALLALVISCTDYTEDEVYSFEAPQEFSERAFGFAELYSQAETAYHWGGQDPLCAIQIDCSGLVVMCYKYALVDTRYHLMSEDMSASWMYEFGTSHIKKSDLQKGNIIFMGEEECKSISHIALFEKIENGRIYFIDSTQKDSNGDGIIDVDGVTHRDYPEDDKRFKAFGRMLLRF